MEKMSQTSINGCFPWMFSMDKHVEKKKNKFEIKKCSHYSLN